MVKINPKVDIAFKKLFGVEENKDLLISLINSIVSEEDQVKDVILLNPHNPQSFKNDKLSILDIKAEGHNKKKFNIEIQITDSADYDKRALYYWARLYAEQLASGEEYSKLNKAIGIHILNFTSILESEKYHNTFHLTEKDTGIQHFKDIELHTIELTKFSQGLDDDFHQLLSKMKQTIDIWAAFLTKYDLLDQKQNELPEAPDYSNLKKALNVISVMNFSDEERNSYEDHLKWLRDETSALNKKYEKGKAEGIEQGKIEGFDKGIRTTAINMLKAKSELEFISKITGLSIEEIKEIQKNIS
jgi:predicted transposase/invertase (TIGR01784 family)